MAKGRLEFNTFVKGLITEAGPLTYPEGASREEQNFVLNRDGSRQRRFGADFETGHELTQSIVTTSSGNITSHKWENPGNNGAEEIAVVQDGNKFWFFNSNAETISAEKLNGGAAITLDTDYVNTVANTASINGRFYIVGAAKEVTEFTYDPDTGLVSEATFALNTRDLWGIDDGLAVDNRTSTYSDAHYYNLRNQGWPAEFKCATNNEGDNATLQDPIEYTYTKRGIYPSNADPITFFKITAPADPDANNSYSPWALDEFVTGTTQTPRGNNILGNIWNRGAMRQAVVPGVIQDRSDGYIIAIAAYAGRLFYGFRQTRQVGGDDKSPNLSTIIMYSQVGSDNVAACHTKNDQTAEDFNDLLDTDGGFLDIPEMGEVLRLVPMGDSLFIIASNGVWSVGGGDTGFSATDQKLQKISNVGALSNRTVIVGEDKIAYWSKGGIYLIGIDKVSLTGGAENITQNTIQQLYDGIPSDARRQAVGVYDETSRQLRWLYRDADLPINTLYNRELILDMNLMAFYENRFLPLPDGSTSQVFMSGYIDVADVLFTSATETVTDGGVEVTDGGVPVTNTSRTVQETTRGSTKYLCSVETGGVWSFTFAQLKNDEFYDWPQIDSGVDSPASMLTGWWLGGVSTQDKRMPYLWIHFRRTEQGFIDTDDGLDMVGQSSCLVQAQWEWTDSVAAGKWGVEFQGYKLPRLLTPQDSADEFDFGYTVVTTKNKVRGSGPALSLNFTSEAGKNCHIYGWAVEVEQEDV